jgi:membrane-bound lytic murein transglycosylase D
MQTKAVIPQSDDSLAVINQKQDSINFVVNLLGLRDLWWVQKAAANKYLVRPPANRDINYIPQFTDLEYLTRIKNINSVIKLSYNDQVRGVINLYCQRKRDLVEFMLGFSEYYFPIFEQIFDKEGVPQELKYLALIESALNPRATSKAGAVGLWQFMYSTGKIYGLKINSFVDERRDPIKATVAAARFLKDLHNMFNDWGLALAAYNCGPGNVKKAIKRANGKTDFWDIYPFLPAETRGYVPAYIAATYVMNYNEKHNLYPREIKIPTTVDTIMVKQRLHLRQVAEVLHIPMQLLEDMNPQYRINIIPYDEGSNPLFLPGEFGEKFIEKQDSIYKYKDSIFFDPEYLRKQPARFEFKENQTATTTKTKHGSSHSKVETTIYTVKKGDNLSKIASNHGVTVDQIKEWNHLKSYDAVLGQSLIVSKNGGSNEGDKIENDDTVKHIAKKERSSKKEKQKSENTEIEKKVTVDEKSETKKEEVVIEKPSKAVSKSKSLKEGDKKETTESKSNIVVYKVKAGDTLWAIAQKYPGVTENEIIKLNGLKNSKALMKGMKLKIKTKS